MIEFKEIKNLRDIKSPFIIKEVLSFININHRLNLIKYNKKLQKISEVDIKDYQKCNGKCIKDGKNGIVREYNFYTNKLIFKGKYLNGKRNGKGKEYDLSGKLKFEGKYLNGERNGKGKEYYDNGILKFEGEFFKDKIYNGKGLFLDSNIDCNVEFEITNGMFYYKKISGKYMEVEKNMTLKQIY